jgi:hypothetical protein
MLKPSVIGGAFGVHLILEVNARDASSLELTDTAHDVQWITISCPSVGYDREIGRPHDPLGNLYLLVQG